MLGAVCAALIALDIYVFFFRRRTGENPREPQKRMQAEQNIKEGGELDGHPKIGDPIRELPASRYSHVELQ